MLCIHQHIETLRSSRCAVQSSHRTEQYLTLTIDFLTRYEYCSIAVTLLLYTLLKARSICSRGALLKDLFELPSHSETWRNILKWTLHASVCISIYNARMLWARAGTRRLHGSVHLAPSCGKPVCSSGSSGTQVRLAGYVCTRLWTCHKYIGNNTSETKTAESGGHSRADRGCGAAAARALQEGSWINPNAAAGWGHRTLPTRFLFLARLYSYPNLVLSTQKSYVFRQNETNKRSWRYHACV